MTGADWGLWSAAVIGSFDHDFSADVLVLVLVKGDWVNSNSSVHSVVRAELCPKPSPPRMHQSHALPATRPTDRGTAKQRLHILYKHFLYAIESPKEKFVTKRRLSSTLG